MDFCREMINDIGPSFSANDRGSETSGSCVVLLSTWTMPETHTLAVDGHPHPDRHSARSALLLPAAARLWRQGQRPELRYGNDRLADQPVPDRRVFERGASAPVRHLCGKSSMAGVHEALRPPAHLLLLRPTVLGDRGLRRRFPVRPVCPNGRVHAHQQGQGHGVYQRSSSDPGGSTCRGWTSSTAWRPRMASPRSARNS